MRILICGDVVGRPGRRTVIKQVPALRRQFDLDFVVVNGENAAGGFGITPKICDQFFAAGIDVLTTGNHVWDQKEILPHLDKEPRLLRPHNCGADQPGTGIGVYSTADGRRVAVLHFMARLFMAEVDDPFACAEAALAEHGLGEDFAAIVVDFHGEASSEKMAMAHFMDGRVSAVVGTHSHVPTADARILEGGTAYMTDIGMCGDYDSVIGMKKTLAVARIRGLSTDRLSPAMWEATLCAVFVETDDTTGLALRVEPLRIGGLLVPQTIG